MVKRKQADDGPPPWQDVVDRLSDENDTDYVLFSGGIDRRSAGLLLKELGMNRSRENVVLILTTYGGLPDAAYLMAKYLHSFYPNGEFTLFLLSYCKSAGTLVALAADQIVMAETAELGPLDVQVIKHGEVGERSSGLTPTQALTSLRGEAISMFGENFRKLREFGFPTRLGAQLASRMAVGLLRPLYEQIDPMRLGEIQRAMTVAADYGERLKSENVKSDAVEKLLANYPSHGFVIDINEARTLFNEVREPTDDEWEMALEVLGPISAGQAADDRGEPARVIFLSRKHPTTPGPDEGDSHEQHANRESGTSEGTGEAASCGTTGASGEPPREQAPASTDDHNRPETNGEGVEVTTAN